MQKTKDKMIVKMQRITSLKAKVIYLTECIKNTVKLFVFKQRICAKSKLWWNNELIERWKTLSSKKRIWKRCRNDDAWTEIVQMQNSYHDAIKLIKNQFWIYILNNIEEKEVFQTYKFTKSHLIEKLLLIQNLQKVNWLHWVEYLSSSQVFNLLRLDLSQNSWLEYSSWVRRFDSSIWVKSEDWDRVLTWNSRFDSSRHEVKYY